MSDRDYLEYLIKELLTGKYEVKVFCSLFTEKYSTKTNRKELSDDERKCFSELNEMTARFSDIEDELKITNLYFNKEQILKKVEQIAKELRINN